MVRRTSAHFPHGTLIDNLVPMFWSDFLYDKRSKGGFRFLKDNTGTNYALLPDGSADQNLIPIVSGIPRFISEGTYAENFGLQWNEFRKTQLDSYTNLPLSENRLKGIIGDKFSLLKEWNILEAGCGAGRFTEILSKNAKAIVAVDISGAIDVAKQNIEPSDKIFFLQADILDLPLRRNFFDAVICIGVLQHTPNTLQALREICQCVKPGGWIFVDHYKRKFKNLYPPFGGFGNVFRLYVKSLDPIEALNLTKKWVSFFFPIHWRFKDRPTIQRILFRVSPVRFYYPWLGLKSKQDYYDWALLDTFDGSSDQFKRRRTKRKLIEEIASLGMINIEVWEGGNGLEARFQKPQEGN